MNQINPYFLIGTLGMLFTSILHIFMGVLTSEEAAATSFWVMYPIFAGFLVTGTIIMMKRKAVVKQ